MAGVDLRDDGMCFVCGRKNPDGLKLSFSLADGEISTRLSFPKKFQGYKDLVHGGMLSTVLDEVMVTLINKLGFLAVTAELNVRFLKPLHVDEKLEVQARLEERRGRTFVLSARAMLEDGTEVATARSTCVNLGPIENLDRGDIG